jgi:hypothetical protein
MAETRDELFQKYEEGPSVLAAALAKVPEGALSWRPEITEWAVDEIIWHCADVEAFYAGRLRYFLALESPPILGLDQDVLADVQKRFKKPTGPAMTFIEAARALNLLTLKQVPEETWQRTGQHSEWGGWTLDNWLSVMADHLHIHARQIEQNIAAWNMKQGQG